MVNQASNYLVEAVIPSDGSLSPEVWLPGPLVAIGMPAAWDAADITVRGGAVSGATGKVTDKSGAEYTVKAVAGDMVHLASGDLVGLCVIQVRSGTAAAPVNQAAARTLQLVCNSPGA